MGVSTGSGISSAGVSLPMGISFPSGVSEYPESRVFVTFDAVLQTRMTLDTPWVPSDGSVIEIDFLAPTAAVPSAQYLFDGSGLTGRLLYILQPSGLFDSGAFGFYTTAELDGVSMAVTGAPYPTDGKLHTLRLVLSATAVNADFAVVGSRFSNTFTFGSILTNVRLTDLSNPSNSEFWKIDRPTGTDTEQSVSGNNLLTYVNAGPSTREVFTKVVDDWIGVETVTQPINLAADWLIVGGATNLTVNSWDTVSAGGIRTGDLGLSGQRMKLDYIVTASISADVEIKDSTTGQGADPTIATVLAGATVNGTVVYNATQGGFYLRNGAASTGNIVSAFSAKRILEVA